MTVAAELAAWTLGPSPEQATEAARLAAVRHLLDGVGCALASARSGAAAPAVTVALGLGGPPEATVLGSRQRVSAPAAALANGALVHGLDFDDTHAGGLVHATSVVLPAAFAVGEQQGATGADVLAAAQAAYEVVCRVAAASPHGFHARGLHATHVAGTLSAATAAGRLLGLAPGTLVDALGIAGSASGGLLEFLDTGSSTKQLHPGTASLSGVLAARLAAAGGSGPASVLEGRYGIWAALSAKPADPASVLDGLGERWEVERITVKPYPACQLMHVTLDALAAALKGAGQVGAGDIESISCDVHPDSASIVCEPAADKVHPLSSYDAKFSLPWSCAALVVDGSVGVATYEPASISRAEVAALAARVRTDVVDPGGVAADAPGRVVVRLTDGRVLEGAVARSAGGPAAPLSDAELDAKFISNAGGDPGAARELAAAVRSLAELPSLAPILDLAARVAAA
jgi:2-methylcitrate dehydratase PrpD